MAKTNTPVTFSQLETQLELYLVKKAPALPLKIKEFIVKFSPWLIVILMLLLLPAFLAVFGFGTLFLGASYLGGVTTGFFYTLSLVGTGAVLILEGVAVPGLFKRRLSAWRLIYYATLLNTILSLLQGNIIGTLISTLISLYILFQIKSYYS